MNDEKALRRVTKKFHSYVSVAYDTIVPPTPMLTGSVDDARDAFLVELASVHLSLKKSLMVCEAEARQVEEYQRERERICGFACFACLLHLLRLPDNQQTSIVGWRTRLKSLKLRSSRRSSSASRRSSTM